ncbi:MAG: phosphatase PAP2 family protein [Candidatus Rokuibacteriota bacterium]
MLTAGVAGIALAALVLVLSVVGVWAALDRRPDAGILRLGCALAGSAVFALIALEAQRRDRPNPVLLFDLFARDGLLGAAAARSWRPIARAVSRLTGEGLAAVVGLAALALALARRRRDAAVVLVGASSAWAVSGLLKLGFGVPRPRARIPWDLFSSFGFPSGHALVTLSACGLLAWSVARGAGGGARLALGLACVVIALAAGAARVVLNAHWPSDILGGLVFGAAWLNLVTLVAARGDTR